MNFIIKAVRLEKLECQNSFKRLTLTKNITKHTAIRTYVLYFGMAIQ